MVGTMLGAVKLTVNGTRELTCFAYINSKYCTKSQETECVQVQVKDKIVYLWAVFLNSVPENTILLNPLHYRLLGLSLHQDVFVSSAYNIREIETLFIQADSLEDQVILEHNQAKVQVVFLEQVRLVVANQKAVIWMSPSMPIVFTPERTGILVQHTTVNVNMIDEMAPQSIIPLLSPVEDEERKSWYNATKGLLRPLFSLPKKMALRALPVTDDTLPTLKVHPYQVFVHEDLIDPKYKCCSFIVALMKNLPPEIPSDEEDCESSWRHEICVEVKSVDSVIYRSLCKEIYSEYIPTILIPNQLNSIIDIKSGTMIMLTFIDSKKLRPPQQVEIVTFNYEKPIENTDELTERFKKTVIEHNISGGIFIINHDMVEDNEYLSAGYVKYRLSPSGLAYTTLTKETFRHCIVTATYLNMVDVTFRNPIVSINYDYKDYCRTVKSLELLIQKVMSHIYFDIHREAQFSMCSDLKSNVLVTGLSGTGKSTLCNLIDKEISVFSHVLRCRPLKGRKDISSVITKTAAMCSDRKPSLLILDDLDALLPANMEGLSPQDVVLYNAHAVDIKQSLFLFTGVTVLMTARVVADLHPIFRLFTGQPMFTAHFNMPELDQDDRVQMFKHLLNPTAYEKFQVDVDDVIRLAMDTGGHSFREIIDYYNAKLHTASKKRRKNPTAQKQRLIEDVTTDSDKAKAFRIWGPLGGMAAVKDKLNECIFWPIMYPALFPSQSCGILLYGPPGTGKSLIGSCLARLEGFNIITIKGPELLSKYIGQSEAAVREVFDKADMKRPCILFFDEFDSLAPKRGHDSTGVTDRVVNQLLARLDGAEGGARGPVIAATSRPDLIDPALLRTGRLSTHIYCELPGLEGRYEVLNTLAKDFNLRRSVDLKLVAEATEGYTPADLKSLLVTAQLSRLDLELLQISLTDDNDEPTLESVVITVDDVRHALLETRPSLSSDQRHFYDIIYRRFRGEGYPHNELHNAAQVPPSLAQIEPKMRVTLA